MAARPGAVDAPEIPVGGTSSKLVKPDEIFDRVVNFFPTEEGGFRSVYAPTPILPRPVVGGPPLNGTPNPTTPVYGTTYGLFHGRVMEGQREILLVQVGTEIWEFEGWGRRWRKLISLAASDTIATADLPMPTTDDFPTQFVSTPTGIVIIPPGGRAHFYDGLAILPLGYDHAPGPPAGLGPESSSSDFWPDGAQPLPVFGVNDSGYTMDSLDGHFPSFMYAFWRQGRVGTVDTPTDTAAIATGTGISEKAQVMGYLRPGRYRAKVQWVDRWGNLSPLSGASNDIRFRKQPAMSAIPHAWVHVDKVLKQIAWDSIAIGPEGTIGRVVARTKDLENSGDIKYYELPTDSMVTEGKYATLQDNSVTTIPDNIPDAWLAQTVTEVDPIPTFQLAAVAFGRLWMVKDGVLWWSMVGRWGTIAKGSSMVPDPTAARITGLHTVARGLLVFTESSTYLIDSFPSDAKYPTQAPLSTTMGCVAPSSIVSVRSGMTIWLGDDGFYGYDGSQVAFMFEDHRQSAKRHNRARLCKAVALFDTHSGEYRCWVAVNGSAINNRCWTFDGEGWHHRNDTAASGAAASQDHRKLALICGIVDDLDGVWVLDRGGAPAVATLTTSWIRSTRSAERGSVRRIRLKLREATIAPNNAAKIQVSMRKDYRAEVVSTQIVNTHPEVATGYGTNPDEWNVAVFGSATWRRRRPFEATADISVPDCETFQIEVTCTAKFEILAFSFEEIPKDTSGGKGYRR